MGTDPENAKLTELEARIRQAGGDVTPTPKDAQVSVKSSRIGFDFVGAIFGGAVLGWAVDKVFPSMAPWGLIGLIMMGFVAGIVNVWRALSAPQSE
jgi:ATP synthase protein I